MKTLDELGAEIYALKLYIERLEQERLHDKARILSLETSGGHMIDQLERIADQRKGLEDRVKGTPQVKFRPFGSYD